MDFQKIPLGYLSKKVITYHDWNAQAKEKYNLF